MLGDKKECATEKTVGVFHGVCPRLELPKLGVAVGSKFWCPIFSKSTALSVPNGVDVQMSAPLGGTPGIRCRSSLATVPLAVPGFPKCLRGWQTAGSW